MLNQLINPSEEKLRVLFYGTPHFSVPALEALLNHPGITVVGVVTQPDKPSGRGAKLQKSPIKEVAEAHGVPVLQPKSIRKELDSFITAVQALPGANAGIDIGVVIAFGQILPTGALFLPKAGSVNIHASLLPRWRGAAPIHRAIEAGDRETGVCLMAMDEGLDTGDVYSEAQTVISPTETTGKLHDTLANLGATLLASDIHKIANGSIKARPQVAEGMTYASKVTSEECLINWSNSADVIARKIRAFSPFPGAYTFINNKRLKIFSAMSAANSSSEGVAGEILSTSSDQGIGVQTGAGVLAIHELQLEGKARASVKDFLNGNFISAGVKLGA